MSWQGRNVLVTGGAGFIGSSLVAALSKAGARVSVLDDLSVGRVENLAGVAHRFIAGSVLDEELLAAAVAEAEVVMHLAVACLRVCFENPEHVHTVNATGTLRLLEACRQSAPRLQRFLYCSSSEVYGSARSAPMDEEHPLHPTTVYGGSKLAGELYTRAYSLTYGMPTTIVRPFNTYGPREHHEGASGEVIPRFLVRIKNGLPPIIFGDGSQTRDFTYVEDTAEGLMRAAERAETLGATLNLARGEEVSIAEIARLLLEKTGRPDLAVVHQGERPADVQRHFAAVARASEWLDYRPPTAIEAGLGLYMAWFDKTYPEPSLLLADVPQQNW